MPIRIGLAGSLSDPVGVPMKRAAELAVEEINAKGGVRGRPLELIERDGARGFGARNVSALFAAVPSSRKTVPAIAKKSSARATPPARMPKA